MNGQRTRLLTVFAWNTIQSFLFFDGTACGDGCLSCASGTVCNNCTAKYTMVDGETTGSRVCAGKYSAKLFGRSNRGFHKHTKLAILAIETLLCENSVTTC